MDMIETYIRQIDLFQNLDLKNIKQLAAICHNTAFLKKQSLFLEGEPGRALFFCVSGNIQLFKITPDGREIVVKIVKSGESFAEVVLFEQEKYPVSAVALRKSNILVLPVTKFHELLEDSDFRDNFIRMLIRKQRYLVDRIRILSIQDIEERLYHFLKEQFGDAPEILPKVSKKDVAAAIGTAPETLSRVLLRLKSAGKLHWIRDKISISPNWRI